MASAADIAAWIGAAAWAPQIAGWVYRRFITPRVTIIPDNRVSIGFTNFGAIFNVRVAISADRADAILEQIAVSLVHDAGDHHEFAWVSLRETFSQIVDEQGGKQTVERDQPAIALKVSTALLSEKFILFQEPSYHAARQPVVDRLIESHNHLRSTSPTFQDDTVKSKEMFDLTQFHQARFWWQPGRYTVRFSIKSPNRAKLATGSFAFTLLKADVDAIRGNLEQLRADWEDRILSGAPGHTRREIFWSWREPVLSPLVTTA